MAAGEQKLEPLVGDDVLRQTVMHGLGHLQLAKLGREGPLSAYAVDGAIASGDQQPGPWVARLAVARPPLSRNRERVRGGLLGEVKVTEEAYEGREDSAPFFAEDPLDQRQASTTGRTSTDPPRRTAGMRSAIPSAVSTLSTSNT